MTRVLHALVVLLLIVVPTAAIAQEPRTNAPPGNSAIDEYLETVPGASGNAVPRPRGAGGASATLSPAERARLERLGPDGKALADAVDATSPAGAAPKPRRATPATAQGRSPVREVLDVATGDDGGSGMGLVLPAILLFSLVGAIVLVVMRRGSVS
jgi:hypothetical protein